MMERTELTELWRAQLPRVEEVHTAAKAWRTAAKLLTRAEGYDGLSRLQKVLDKADASALPDPQLQERLAAVSTATRAWLDAEWTRRAEEIGLELEVYFAHRGVPVVLTGDVLAAGALHIRIEPRADRATLCFADEEVRARVPLAPERLYREWEAALGRLERAGTEPTAFAEELVTAYGTTARAGARVPLPRVHFAMFVARQPARARQDPRKGRLRDYPRAQFAWDLHQWLEAGAPTPPGGEIEVLDASTSAARSARTSVRVPGRVLGDVRVR